MTNSEIKKYLKEFKPDLVGITNNYTNQLCDVLELSKLIKGTLPNSFVVLGGAHAKFDHENLVKEKEIDAVVRGEGEITFKQLVLALYDKESLTKIKGLTFRKNNMPKINPDRSLIKDINSLPIPDRSFIPYEKYLAKTPKAYFRPKNKPVATLFTSRGCPFNCIFCSTQKFWTKKWRPRNPENMVKEIEYLMKTYGVKEISFEDDQFMGDKNRIKEFCKLVIKKKLKITLIVPPGISPALLDEKIMRVMKRAGFYRICFSIDVGTNQARNYVKKPVRLEKMRGLIKRANNLGFWTFATFVIGFPFEKIQDIKDTIKYAYNLRLDYLKFYIVAPQIGSEFYDICIKEKLLNKKEISKHQFFSDSIFGTKHIKPEQLKKLRYGADVNYYRYHIKHFLNPMYIVKEFFPKINSISKFFYFLGILKTFYYNFKK